MCWHSIGTNGMIDFGAARLGRDPRVDGAVLAQGESLLRWSCRASPAAGMPA
jgi:hypothetical protein